jgi:gliding motility-associated lipoprotein GldH
LNKFKFQFSGSLIRAFAVLLVIFIIASCNKIDFFEKTVSFKNHEWSASNKATINFDVSDTAADYNLFVVLRHSDAYGYNNIWLNLTVIPPGDTARSELKEFQLAKNNKEWLGSGMDDIFEHRIKVNPQPFKCKAGNYTFILQQMMREDPLEHVLNAGIRVEKAK